MTSSTFSRTAANTGKRQAARPLPWPLRSFAWILILLQLTAPVTPQLLAAAVASPPSTVAARSSFATPPPAPVVKVNRTLPKVSPLSLDLAFSAHPTDEEISKARVFDPPITSVGGSKSATENSDLATARSPEPRRLT